MFAYPLRAAALAAAAITLAGCATNGLYGGVGVGSGGYYGSQYGYGYGAGYPGYGYGYQPYWGWYDGFYYPGTGYYVYDRYRRPYRWSDRYRRYWTQRREMSLLEGFRRIADPNWSDFDRNQATTTRRIQRSVDSPVVIDRTTDRPSRIERRQGRSERGAARLERQSERSAAREQRRSEARSERAARRNAQQD